MKKPYKVIILGAGYRGRVYAAYAEAHPEQLKIVGVADPVQAQSIRAERYWSDWHSVLDEKPEADILVVSLPDGMHHEAAVRGMRAGYHLLLEKPLACSVEDCEDIVRVSRETGKLAFVGHVLRYSHHLSLVKATIDSGEIGEVVSIAHQESVGYGKIAHSYCRGIWSNSEESSPIILTKCSHDFDLFVWWLNRKCKKIVSFGNLKELRRENQPKGAADRCSLCPPEIERNCPWSAKKLYEESADLHYLFADSSPEAMRKVVEESRYGRCVYACDNDVPDHQSVLMEFEGGVDVTHVMSGFTLHNMRSSRISCTKGEIIVIGDTVTINRFDGRPTTVSKPLPVENKSRHGGGDFNLVEEFVETLDRNDLEEFRKVAEDALAGHLIAFAAERSRVSGGKTVELN